MVPFDLNSSFINHILHIVQGLQVHLLPTLFDLLVGILTIRILVRVVRLVLKATQIQTGLRYVITSIIETLLWIFLIIILLQELGLTGIIVFFTGSIAAIGLAMAMGGSTLVSDIVAAIFLARDRDFNVGDEVIVGDSAKPAQGVIVSMDARRIRLRDDEDILHVVPNSQVERNQWTILHRRSEISALARAAGTAKRIGASALEKRTNRGERRVKYRKNEQ